MINGCRWCNAIAGPVDGHGAVRRHADCPHPTPAFCTARIVRRMAASVKGRGRVIDLKLLPGSLIIGTYPVGNCSTATSCPFSALIDLCFVGLRRFLITEILVGSRSLRAAFASAFASSSVPTPRHSWVPLPMAPLAGQ